MDLSERLQRLDDKVLGAQVREWDPSVGPLVRLDEKSAWLQGPSRVYLSGLLAAVLVGALRVRPLALGLALAAALIAAVIGVIAVERRSTAPTGAWERYRTPPPEAPRVSYRSRPAVRVAVLAVIAAGLLYAAVLAFFGAPNQVVVLFGMAGPAAIGIGKARALQRWQEATGCVVLVSARGARKGTFVDRPTA